MKKFNFAKIVSFVMVCAMLMGALAIGVFATEDVVVDIVSNNVYYDEKFEIMYAIKAPEGATIEAVDSEGNEIRVLPFTDEDGKTTANIDGVDYPMYVLEDGVAAQAIDEVITITVTAGENVATQEYSVLEYIYERMYVKADVKGAELDMFNALLAYANAADIAINKASAEESLGNLVYVSAVDCTFDGATSGLVKVGSTLYFDSNLVTGEGKVVNYEVTDLESGSTTTVAGETMANDGYVVTGPVNVTAVIGDASEKVKQFVKVESAADITDGKYVIILSGTEYALGNFSSGWVTTASPVVSGNVVTNTADAVWTLTVTESGVKLADSNGAYIKPSGGNNNGIQTGEYVWELVWNDDNTVSFNGVGGDTTILAANKNSAYKFRAYKSSTVTGTPTSYPSTFVIYKFS